MILQGVGHLEYCYLALCAANGEVLVTLRGKRRQLAPYAKAVTRNGGSFVYAKAGRM
jgi:hypothetical protein